MSIRLALSLVLTALAIFGTSAPAAAQGRTGTYLGSCVFAGGAFSCASQYRYRHSAKNGIAALREPNEDDIAESRERDRRWVERCRPQLRTDAYGVNRYVYAARGCEYGQDRD
jgi:hypothetical protein